MEIDGRGGGVEVSRWRVYTSGVNTLILAPIVSNMLFYTLDSGFVFYLISVFYTLRVNINNNKSYGYLYRKIKQVERYGNGCISLIKVVLFFRPTASEVSISRYLSFDCLSRPN